MNSHSKAQLTSISSASDLIDAKLEEHQLCGSKHCPGCGHKLQGSKPDWVGLPAGVKFDPTDQELLEHLEAKVEVKSSKSHPLIDEFIPTIEGEDGICYTHPEKFPGVTKNGLSRHFFHRPSKAYTTGTRKRRKIQPECNLQGGETRWHKTGKTRPVMVNGKQKGCKKILVLYTNFGKNRKPEKTNWVMHQYHLGQLDEEKEGELVVSKIFYQTQPRQCNWILDRGAATGSGGELGGRRESGGGSGSTSSREVVTHHIRDDQMCISVGVVGGVGTTVSSYNSALDLQQLGATSEHFNIDPFCRQSFDEAGIGDASAVRADIAGMSAACNDHETRPQHHVHHPHHAMDAPHHHHHAMDAPHHHHHHHHTHRSIVTTDAFTNRPTHPISHIISQPPLHSDASIIFDDDSFQHVSRLMQLQHETLINQQQQQETEQQNHKQGRRSASCLEEIIMGCTPSAPDSSGSTIKEESSMTNNPSQEADWMKYSTFWHDPNQSDHHDS